MAERRFFASYGMGGTFTDANGRTLGIQVDVNGDAWMLAHMFFRPTADCTLPTSAAAYVIATGAEIAGTVVTISGLNPAETGWITVPLPAPVKLPKVSIRDAVSYPAGSNPVTKMPGQSNYWSSGGGGSGLTAGPISAPGSATAVGQAQGPYNIGATRVMPATTNSSKANYGVDILISDTDPTSPLIWKADLDAGSTATTNVQAGYQDNGTQRQNGAGQFNDTSTPWPLPTVTAPKGRPGRAIVVSVPDNYRRVEQQPNHQTFTNNDGPFYFSHALYLETWTTGPTTYWQTVEQLKQASTTGSPPIGFEVRENRLHVGGGWGIDTVNQTRLQYDLSLADFGANEWIDYVYRLDRFSTAEGGSKLDVWVRGVSVLSGFTIPPPTVIPDTAGTNGYATNTYRKQGIYHSETLPGATLYSAGAAFGTTYEAVDPARIASYPRPGAMFF